MPYKADHHKITRGSICRNTRWVVHLRIMCSDRIPLNQATPLFMSIYWNPPKTDGEVTLKFSHPNSSPKVKISFDQEGKVTTKTIKNNFRGLLALYGQLPTPGTESQVTLEVIIDDEVRERVPLFTGDVNTDFTISPDFILKGSKSTITADAGKSGVDKEKDPPQDQTGTFQWIAVEKQALPIPDGVEGTSIEISGAASKEHQAAPYALSLSDIQENGHPYLMNSTSRRLCVLYKPNETAPAVMKVHHVEVSDLNFPIGEDLDPHPDVFVMRVPEKVHGPCIEDPRGGFLAAFGNACTHMGCHLVTGQRDHDKKTITFEPSIKEKKDQTLICGPCPCHGTSFDLMRSGLVILGPATQNLPQPKLSLSEDENLVLADFPNGKGIDPRAEQWPFP